MGMSGVTMEDFLVAVVQQIEVILNNQLNFPVNCNVFPFQYVEDIKLVLWHI